MRTRKKKKKKNQNEDTHDYDGPRDEFDREPFKSRDKTTVTQRGSTTLAPYEFLDQPLRSRIDLEFGSAQQVQP